MTKKQRLIIDFLQAGLDNNEEFVGSYQPDPNKIQYQLQVPLPSAALPMSVDSFNSAINTFRKINKNRIDVIDWRHGDPIDINFWKL